MNLTIWHPVYLLNYLYVMSFLLLRCRGINTFPTPAAGMHQWWQCSSHRLYLCMVIASYFLLEFLITIVKLRNWFMKYLCWRPWKFCAVSIQIALLEIQGQRVITIGNKSFFFFYFQIFVLISAKNMKERFLRSPFLTVSSFFYFYTYLFIETSS